MCFQLGLVLRLSTQNASLEEMSSMLILILIDLFYVIPQRRVPYRLRCYLMTKNLNEAAIDSAQFGTWLVSHLWGNFLA